MSIEFVTQTSPIDNKMTTTTESYHSTYTKDLIEHTISTANDEDPSLIVANVTIDELVESCCNEVLSSSSQMNTSSVSPTHLVRFVHSQASLVSQIDDTNPIQQSPSNISHSSHDTPIKQAPLINVTRLPSPFSTLKPIARIESNSSMHNTTNLTNITANNISVNNYNVNIHTTHVQTPTPTPSNVSDHLSKTIPLDEKQTTEIVSQILKNIKEVENNNSHEQHHQQQQQQQQQQQHQAQQSTANTTTTNYNIHIDSFNFSSAMDQNGNVQKKSRVKKEAKALTRIIVKDEPTSGQLSNNSSPNKTLSVIPITAVTSTQQGNVEFIAVPYGWQRKVLASDIVVYLSPTNAILDSLDAVRRYLESPTSCKCGLQCPLIVDKVFNFDSNVKSKSWEVTQVLEGTHCRQKSNILEMATLTNCIDSFCKTEQKPIKRRKRVHQEANNGNVFVCASNTTGNSNQESVVLVNNAANMSDGNSSTITWTSPVSSTNGTPPSKRPRGRPRKTTVTPPTIAQLAVKPSSENQQLPSQPVPLSILSPPASVSSTNQNNLMHRNSTSPSTSNLRYLHEHVLTPPIIPSTTTATDTHVIARVPALFDQVKTTTNESTFAVLSGVQNVLLSPNRDNHSNLESKLVRVDSTTNLNGKQVTLNVNALKPDFVRSPTPINGNIAAAAASAQKPCLNSSNQIDVISLMGANNSNELILSKVATKTIGPGVPSTVVTVPPTVITTANDDQTNNSLIHSNQNEQIPIGDNSQPLMIDFNDPSTTNFLLSALASGASSDSNAIVNHLFQKAQTQQRVNVSSPTSIKHKLPIIASGLKNCTETTNLLPSTNSSTVHQRQPAIIQTSTINETTQQTIVLTHGSSTDEQKNPQQIFFINNKPYVIQQKITNDQSLQQRFILTPSLNQSEAISSSDRSINSNGQNNSNSIGQSTLDDGGNCLRLNGAVEPKTLRSLLKGLNSSSFSGVDNLIDTIHRFEHTSSVPTSDQQNTVLIKSARSHKASPNKKAGTEKTAPVRRRTNKKTKQEETPITSSVITPLTNLSQPMLIEQHQQNHQHQHQHHQQLQQQQQHQQTQQWQTDFNTLDFSTPWGSDTNLNSLLLNDDFDTAASFDDVNFGDFEPYMNTSNHSLNNDPMLPSLFVKPFPPDSLPSVDHLLQ